MQAMNAHENGRRSVNGTLVPLGSTSRTLTTQELREQVVWGLKLIAPLIGMSENRLRHWTSAGSMGWLGHRDGRYWTLTGSAEHFRDVVLPSVHALASRGRGLAGRGAVDRGEDGTWIARI